MKIACIFLFALLGWSQVLTITVPAPDFSVTENQIILSDASYHNPIGAPNVPAKTVTIALPPGAIIESVDFSGYREVIGKVFIQPTRPPLPLIDDGVAQHLLCDYQNARERYYSSGSALPQEFGRIIARGGLRKYTIVSAACFHYAYAPASQTVFRAPEITINIHYTMPDTESERARFWADLKDDVTFDQIAKKIIYNWNQAQTWYHTDAPRQATGYYIILPSAITSAVDSLVAYRQAQGYDVHVVTREYIESNITGVDLVQKFRNFLRANMADIAYALLVGFSTDMPWRSLVPFNNDPNSPWNHPDYSPIPGDIYLAELTDPDSLSWNSDGDAYWGEVYDQNWNPVGEDDPDFHADIHLSRIPFSTPSTIQDIIGKLIAFDSNTDVGYKTASLLTGALYYYANENYGGNARIDGAEFCEEFLTDSLVPRATATTLYEKDGLRPCTLTCTDSLTHSNHIVYWQNKGIMYECHHGNVTLYARKLWAWDDGDSVPENPEISWPTSLQHTDVYGLDNTHPATCFLRSCLCGKPEETGLGAMLLYRGGSDVISSSRISWMSGSDRAGIPYHFYYSLLQDTLVSQGITGDAYDIANITFMNNCGFWIPVYHYNMYGDPALQQFGRIVATKEQTRSPAAALFNVYPSPSTENVTIRFNTQPVKGTILTIHDVTGRLIEQYDYETIGRSDYFIWSGKDHQGNRVPAGVYVITCIVEKHQTARKIVITR
jgi:hypothetical protein